jgi:hypothetical protein
MEQDEDAAAPAGAEAAAVPAAPATRRPAPRKPAARRRKPKRVRWSAKREATFLETLAQTANVAASARAAGLSDSSVYRHRQTSDAFRAKWAVALAEGFERLETMMLDRALNGTEKPVWYGGKRVGTITEYSDRTALALLAHHRGTVRGSAVPTHDMSVDDWRTHWDMRLRDIQRRLRGAD